MHTYRHKLLLLLGFAICVAACDSRAARAQQKSYKIGVQAGLTSMTYGGEAAGDFWNRKRGHSFGALFIAQFPNDIGHLQAGLNYVQKGAQTTIQSGDITVSERIEYLSIPFLAKLELPISRTVTPNLLGGFISSFAIGAERTFRGPQGSLSETIDPSNVPVTEWALALGAGIDIGLYAPVTLVLDGRYTFGLNSAPSSLTDVEGASFRNQGFTVNAGLAFAL